MFHLLETDPVAGVAFIALVTSAVSAVIAILVQETKDLLTNIVKNTFGLFIAAFWAKETVYSETFTGAFSEWIEKHPHVVLWSLYRRKTLTLGGKMLVLFQGHPLLLELKSEEKETSALLIASTLAFFRGTSTLSEFITFATTPSQDVSEKTTLVSFPNPNKRWERIPLKEMDSVVLPPAQKENLVEIIQEFYQSKDWYHQRGVPYRMGILLEGPPGSGKTSLAKALAGYFDARLVLSSPRTISEDLERARDSSGSVSILLIEDLSALNLGTQEKGGSPKDFALPSLSEFLNAVDGVSTPQNIIFLFTANNVDALDPAILRAGRVDLRIKFDNATKEQAGALYRRFFPEKAHLAGTFADHIPDRKLSMAALQFEMVMRKKDPESVVEWARQLQSTEVT